MLVILLASTFNTYNKCISLQYEKSSLHNTRDGFSRVIVQEHSSWTTALKQISIVPWMSVPWQSWLCWTHHWSDMKQSHVQWILFFEHLIKLSWTMYMVTYMWKCWLTVACKIIASLEYDLLPMANWENKWIKIVK